MEATNGILFDPEEAKARGYDTRGIALARFAQAARSEAMQLLEAVETAFDGVPRPWITLSVAGGYDDEWNLTPEREAELRACDPEEDWREVDVSGIHAFWYFNFSEADPESCRFYLPAFLREELHSFPFSAFSDRSEILWLFEKPSSMSLLNEAQMSCLNHFAELCERYPEWPSDEHLSR